MNIYDVYYKNPDIDEYIVGMESCKDYLDSIIPPSYMLSDEEYDEAFESLTGYRDEDLTDEEFEYVLESIFGPDLNDIEYDYVLESVFNTELYPEEWDLLIAEEGILSKLGDKLQGATKWSKKHYEKKVERENEDLESARKNQERAADALKKAADVYSSAAGTTFDSFRSTRRIKAGLSKAKDAVSKKLTRKSGESDKDKSDDEKRVGKAASQAAKGSATVLGAAAADLATHNARRNAASTLNDAIKGFNNPMSKSPVSKERLTSSLKDAMKSGDFKEYQKLATSGNPSKKALTDSLKDAMKSGDFKEYQDLAKQAVNKEPNAKTNKAFALGQKIGAKVKTSAAANKLSGKFPELNRKIEKLQVNPITTKALPAASLASKAVKAINGPEARVMGRSAIRAAAATQSLKNQEKRVEKMKKEGDTLTDKLTKASYRAKHYDRKLNNFTKKFSKETRDRKKMEKQQQIEKEKKIAEREEEKARRKAMKKMYKAQQEAKEGGNPNKINHNGEAAQEGLFSYLGEKALASKQKKMAKAGEKAKQLQIKADAMRQKNELRLLKEEAKLNKRLARNYYADDPDQLERDKRAMAARKYEIEAKAKKYENNYRKNLAMASGSKKTFDDVLMRMGGVSTGAPIQNASGGYYPQNPTLGSISISRAEAENRMNQEMRMRQMQSDMSLRRGSILEENRSFV